MWTDETVERMVTFLFRLAPYARISRHSPGKIKIKFRLLAIPVIQKAQAEDLPRPRRGIIKSRVRYFSRSLEVEYDPAIFPCALWEDVIRTKEEPSLRDSLRERLKRALYQALEDKG